MKKTQLFNDIEHGDYIIGERDENGNPTIIPLYKISVATEILRKYSDTDPENSRTNPK